MCPEFYARAFDINSWTEYFSDDRCTKGFGFVVVP